MRNKIQKYLSGEREGFSLIELIIVIAIMAILIGVVALVVLPYLESSRESTDRAALNEVATAFKSAMTSAEFSKTTFTKKDATGLDEIKENGVKLSERVNDYLEKSITDTEAALGSEKTKTAKFYFTKSTTGEFLVYLSKDSGATAVKDSDGVPYSSNRKPVTASAG